MFYLLGWSLCNIKISLIWIIQVWKIYKKRNKKQDFFKNIFTPLCVYKYMCVCLYLYLSLSLSIDCCGNSQNFGADITTDILNNHQLLI